MDDWSAYMGQANQSQITTPSSGDDWSAYMGAQGNNSSISDNSTGLTGQIWPDFVNVGTKMAKERNYPADVLLAQAALESGHGTSQMAMQKNNYFGYEAYNSNPDAAAAYKNPQDSINAYIDLIQKDPNYSWAYNKWLQDHNSRELLLNIVRSHYAVDQENPTPDQQEQKAQTYTADAFAALGGNQ